jgi:murein DD-endopeptidase MepM/ murein hydrolase activator NlpD
MTSFDVEMQFPVDPDGFTKVYGGPNQGGHQGSDWYIQYGMDLGGSAGTNVYAAFDGHVTKFHPHNPASDAGGVYGAQITDVPASIHGESSPGAGDGSQVERGDFLGTVISFGGIPPHLHLALVEIIGGAPNGQYVGVNLYQFFIDLETTYAGECVPVTFMQDGTPPTTN